MVNGQSHEFLTPESPPRGAAMNLMKRWLSLAVLMGVLVSTGTMLAQTAATAFRIERLDAALDDLIAPDAKLETLGDRFALTEGPVWMPGENGQPGFLL